MFWLLVCVLLLACLLALGLTLLTLWRRTKALGAQVAGVTAAVDEASAAVDAARAAGPVRAQPCPTCGAPASAATKTPAAVHQ